MSLFFPIEGSGIVPDIPRDVIYSSLGSVVAVAGYPLTVSLALETLNGTAITKSIAAETLRGERLTGSLGALDGGRPPLIAGLGSIDTGAVKYQNAAGIAAISAEVARAAFASLITDMQNSVSGAIVYLSYGSIISKAGLTAAALASISARAQQMITTRASLKTRLALYLTSRVTFEVGANRYADSLATLDDGTQTLVKALASLEIEEGAGIEFMIDILDAILYGGHGDDC